MGFVPSPKTWWDEWKLHILVLCSLFVQFFLFLSKYVLQSYRLRKLRALVWLAYIGGNALAINALATLYNRLKQHTEAACGGGGLRVRTLELTWVPVLLTHLGGEILINAHSIEDNDLWKRHAVTLVSQVTVALYVFCNNWWSSGDQRLLQAANLLFIVVIIKFGEKPWALRRASYGSTSTNLSSPPRRAEEESSSDLRHMIGKLCTALCTCTNLEELMEKRRGGGVGEKGTNYLLEEYVNEAQKHVKEGPKESDEAQLEKFDEDEAFVMKDIYKMFLDLSAPYSIRLHYLQSFLNLDGENQHKVLREWIHWQFWVIYTKARSGFTCLDLCRFLVLLSLPIASAVLFAKSDKEGNYRNDVMVTYILFFGTVVIELGSFFIGVSCRRLFQCNLLSQKLTWQDMVAQHNIMSSCARKKNPPALMKLATFSYLRDFINKHWYIGHQWVAQHISMLVRHHTQEDGWKEYIRDSATYRRFNNLRGEHTLMKMSHHLLEQDKLGWTFNLPFDEYVLLWHLATDLCIHQTTDGNASAFTSQGSISSRRSSEIISNYMIYLLFICPEMLIPGVRQDLFILACDDIEDMIKDQPLLSLDERSIAQRVLCMGQDGDERMTLTASRIMSKAYKLAS